MKRISIRSASAFVLSLFITAITASANTATWTNTPAPLGTDVIAGGGGGPVVGNLDGFIVNDLILDTTSDWTTALLQVTLTSGSIFQEDEGFLTNGVTLGQPDPAGFGFLPSSEFDSYVFDPHGGAFINAACGIGPCPHTQFDTSEIDIAWNSAGDDTADIGIFSIARVTLSPDAQGTWLVRFAVAGLATPIETSGVVVNGALVPEPATLTLLALGGLGLLRRRLDRRGDNN